MDEAASTGMSHGEILLASKRIRGGGEGVMTGVIAGEAAERLAGQGSRWHPHASPHVEDEEERAKNLAEPTRRDDEPQCG